MKTSYFCSNKFLFEMFVFDVKGLFYSQFCELSHEKWTKKMSIYIGRVIDLLISTLVDFIYL